MIFIRSFYCAFLAGKQQLACNIKYAKLNDWRLLLQQDVYESDRWPDWGIQGIVLYLK